ncbi:MAG: hypothetical protein ABFD84_07325 [Candidatus Polarisedimenticolia bacterium]
MNERASRFVEEVRGRVGTLPPRDAGLAALRARRRDEILDATVIGGTTLADLLRGSVDPASLPPDVREAFALQYPHQDIAALLREHAGNPDELAGIVNGVKGKLFELRYLDHLNHGGLPDGCTAELAHGATQPGWDVVVHDAHGHVVELLQLKATESAEYVAHALERYPGIDVVATREAFDSLHDPELAAHVVKSSISDAALTEHVHDSLQPEFDQGFHLPFFAFAVIALQSLDRAWKGADIGRVAAEAARRGIFSTIASAVGHATLVATHVAPLAIPASVGTRLALTAATTRIERTALLAAAAERERARRAALERGRADRPA